MDPLLPEIAHDEPDDPAAPDAPAPPFSPHHHEKSRSTGPTSPTGKANSSQNRLTHGCCAEKLVLRHEDPAEFERLRDAWLAAYPDDPEDDILLELIHAAAEAHRGMNWPDRRRWRGVSCMTSERGLWGGTAEEILSSSCWKGTTTRSFGRFWRRWAWRGAR